MAKRPPDGKCVHCLRDHVPRTWDHVFPESWYPNSTPANLYKWQIPACRECNKAYGEMEQDLLIRIGLCIDPDQPGAAGVTEKVLRSLDPRSARGERDRRAREAKRNKILKGLLSGDQIPAESIYPRFGEKWGRPRELQTAVTIPAKSVRKLTEKIVRGILYLEDEKFIEAPWSIDFYALHDEAAAPIISLLDRFGKEYAREPGIVVRRAVASEDGISSILSIEIWNMLIMYAAVSAAT